MILSTIVAFNALSGIFGAGGFVGGAGLGGGVLAAVLAGGLGVDVLEGVRGCETGLVEAAGFGAGEALVESSRTAVRIAEGRCCGVGEAGWDNEGAALVA